MDGILNFLGRIRYSIFLCNIFFSAVEFGVLLFILVPADEYLYRSFGDHI